MTLKDGYWFGGVSRAPPSKQHLSTPPRGGGGGVALYAKDTFKPSHPLDIHVPDDLEVVWIKLQPPRSTTISLLVFSVL